MTDKERIADLERRVAELEAVVRRLAAKADYPFDCVPPWANGQQPAETVGFPEDWSGLSG